MPKSLMKFVVFIALLFAVLSVYLIYEREIDLYTSPFTKRSPETNTLSPKLLWTHTGDLPIRQNPVWNNSIVVLRNDSDSLIALDNGTGELVWQYTTTNSFLAGQHLALTEQVLVGVTRNNELFALDTTTGQEIWKISIIEPLTQPPDILIIQDVVVIAQRTTLGNSHVSTYNIDNGEMLWDISPAFPRNDYSGLINCPNINISQSTQLTSICVIFYENIYVIAPLQNRLLGEILSPFSLSHRPQYKNNAFFSRINENKTDTQVFDLMNNTYFALSLDCSGKNSTYSPSFSSMEILVSNGCNELFRLPLENLRDTPDWIYTSPIPTSSSFVTIDGEKGYILNETGDILEIDLQRGEIEGKFSTIPHAFMENRMNTNGLYINPPYLYAIIDEGNLFVFKH